MSKPDEYVVGGTVQAGDGLYIERSADEELLVLCRTRAFVYILSTRQVGKSSLMTHTAETLAKEGVYSVIIDLSESGVEEVTAEQWYIGLIREIQEQLPIEIDVQSWWAEQSHLPYGQRLTSFFKDILLKQISAPVVIFVDEIDTTRSLTFTDDFYAAIRSIYNARARVPEYQRLSFVLVGVATPTDLIRDTKRTPFNIGQRVELSDFTFKEALPLTAGLGLSADKAQHILAHVLRWTGGHPYLTLSVFRQIAEEIQKGKRDWSENDIDHVVDRTFLGSDGDSNLRFVRDMLTVHAPDLESVLNTYREIFRGRNPVADEERSLVKSHLKLSGVVQSESANLYIRNNVYRKAFDEQWIRNHLPINWPKRLQRAVRIAAALFFIALLPLSIYAWSQKLKAEKAAVSEHVARQEAERAAKSERMAREDAERAANSERMARKDADAQRHVAEEQRRIAESAAAAERSATQLAESRRKTAVSALAEAQTAKAAAEEAEKEAKAAKADAEARGQVAFARQLEIQAEGSLDKNDTAAAQAFLANALLLDDRVETRSRLLNVIMQSARRQWTIAPRQDPDIRFSMSGDGRFLASSAGDKKILIWDTQAGLVKHVLSGVEPNVSRIILSQDGRTLTVMSISTGATEPDGPPDSDPPFQTIISTYDVATGKRIRRFSDLNLIGSVAVIGNGGKFLALNAETVRVFNLETGETKKLVGSTPYGPQALSPNGQLFAGRGADRVIRLWDIEKNAEIGRLNQEAPAIGSNIVGVQLVFSPDNKLLASHDLLSGSTVTSVVTIWDVASRTVVYRFSRADVVDIKRLAFSASAPQVSLILRNGGIILWNFKTDQTSQSLPVQTNAAQSVSQNNSEFSLDGKRFAFQVDDQDLGIWDVEAGKRITTLTVAEERPEGHRSSVRSIAFSPRGDLVASGDTDYEILIWETATGRFVRRLSGQQTELSSIAFSSDGELLASGGTDATISLWDVKTGKLSKSLSPHIGTIRAVVFSPVEPLLAAAGADRKIYLWNTKEQREVFTISEPQPTPGVPPDSDVARRDGVVERPVGVLALAFSQDGKLLASGSDDAIVRVYKTQTHELLKSFPGHRGPVRSVAFNPADGSLASASSDGTIRFWQLDKQTELSTLYLQDSAAVSMAFTPDGQRLALGTRDVGASGSDKTPIRLWNVKTRKWITTLRSGSDAENVAFSPDGRLLASGGSDRKLRLWRLEEYLEVPVANRFGSFAVSPDGETLASFEEQAGLSGSLALRDIKSGRVIRTLSGLGTSVGRSLAFSRDGQLLALAVSFGASDSPTTGPTLSTIRIRIWEVATGKLVREFSKSAAAVGDILFSPDGHVLLLGERQRELNEKKIGTNQVVFLDLQTGKTSELPFDRGVLWSMAFSPDGNLLAIGGGGADRRDPAEKAVTVWDLNAHEKLFSLRGKSGAVLSLAFGDQSDGRFHSLLLAMGEGNGETNRKDQTLRLIDVRSQKTLPMFTGFTETVSGISFSPKESGNQLLATGGEADRIWNLERPAAGAEDSLLLNVSQRFNRPTFSLDGKWLAGLTDQGLTLWDMKQVNWVLSSQPKDLVQHIRLMTGLDVRGIDELGFKRLTQDQLKERLGEKYRSSFRLIPLAEY